MKKNTLLAILILAQFQLLAQLQKKFEYMDVFELEYTADPQISPDGKMVVYRRMGFDVMKDRSRGTLWLVSSDGKEHRKLTSFEGSQRGARWSPSGDRIAYIQNTDEGSEIYVHWLQSGVSARLTQLVNSPSSLIWSPDGKRLAFTMKEDAKAPVLIKMPAKPMGAEWAKPARITDRLKYEQDGTGYIKPGYTHIYTVPAAGGSPRKMTSWDRNHSGPLSWSPDGLKIFFSSNLNEDWEYDFRNSEVYAINTETLIYQTFTDRPGPDSNPVMSPDGRYIATVGFEDKVQTYQLKQIEIMDSKGKNRRILTKGLDRNPANLSWAADSKGLYFMYNDLGKTKLAFIDLNGKVSDIVDNLGGLSIGRPYGSGAYSVSKDGTIVYTISYTNRPADLAITRKGSNSSPREITQLNEDILASRLLGPVEEIWYKSSVDGRDLHGYIVYPPDFDKRKKYPLLVENHGGPILNYGPHFSAEIQLFAASGYMVFYPNPRGSTSYGEEFGNLLYNNYPGDDYQDVIDGVDAVIERGKVDPDQLYVTGGSAGGIMTAWIIGKTDRFKAAVVAKPVINWISKTLVADNYYGYANSRYPGQPWENFEGYWKFSPLSLVGNIKTPTMVMVGQKDLRTPPSEAKQLYHALKLRKVETVLVELPDASHDIASRPSQLISKVAHILAWFEKYRGE